MEANVPPGHPVELIIVDNASTDDTPDILSDLSSSSINLRILTESSPGKPYALNHAVRKAEGSILLFTDDDVRVPVDWIERMIQPLANGSADAVAGGVVLPEHLKRDWMNRVPISILALSESLDPEQPSRLIGANMALHRRVFEVIPQFDPNLGPGRLGLEEETLLAHQLQQAGFRIIGALDVTVEHHFDSERLKHPSFKAAMHRLGQSKAYVSYHWRHQGGSRLRSLAGILKAAFQIGLRRFFSKAPEEGMPEWEQAAWRNLHYHKQMLIEAGKPRSYDPHGLCIKNEISNGGERR